jgi:hypothetical protein
LVLSRRQLYDDEVEYQHTHDDPWEEEPMEEELEENVGDGIVEDGVMPESNLESSTPYELGMAMGTRHPRTRRVNTH